MIKNPPIGEFSGELKPYGKQLPVENRRLKVAITIPAKNEADTIWSTLHSLASQVSNNGLIDPEEYEIMVLCNHCRDNTLERCLLFQELHPDFPLYIFETQDPVINCVGAARRLIMDLASKRLKGNGFIVMTDADTIADKYWLDAYLNIMPSPTDLVCGIIEPDLKDLNKEAKHQLFQTRKYLDLVTRLESDIFPQDHDPWPRHSHNSGPNMAIRNSVYIKLGGMPPIACLEDIALYQKVISNGYKVKHCSAPIVTTSCRSSSRVPGGFGTQIKNWSNSLQESVEGLEKLTERFKAYSEIRSYYEKPSNGLLNSFCKRLHFQPSAMRSLLRNHSRSSSLIIYLEQVLKYHTPWNIAHPNISLDKAIEQVSNHFSNFSQTISSYSSSR
ncbi:glycosyltransferase [Christiangramia echinicola]|uniref:glycosyltransferase n=1 Tax=Christiangramia echinicola TaxID=279359 RepID=UPI00047A8CB8|nr:glycosyltransferase family 2 protein [Christiangramia echinicola]